MPKKSLPLILGLFVILAISALGFFAFKPKGETAPEISNKRQIINALDFKDRPFVALFPHETNKLITMYLDKPGDIPELTIDLEYLSGNALKGGRTTVKFPVDLPYTQAFLLGSCSSGGKCSFDTNITTGTIKTKIENDNEVHVLKSNYVFINDESATTDQKLKFTPSTRYSAQAILAYTHGYLSDLNDEPASEPFVITSASPDTVTGSLTVASPDATKILYFDGIEYQEIAATKTGSEFTIELNQEPWSQDITIIRDDLKGAQEETTLYLVGPFVPVK